jgi:hypothetical protein
LNGTYQNQPGLGGAFLPGKKQELSKECVNMLNGTGGFESI